ncbi:hypothetical protein TNCV_2793141 [Trichonephila clavipes]|nr:hypothetical protein TNCV_2793141 [Trichonephila clavipes]
MHNVGPQDASATHLWRFDSGPLHHKSWGACCSTLVAEHTQARQCVPHVTRRTMYMRAISFTYAYKKYPGCQLPSERQPPYNTDKPSVLPKRLTALCTPPTLGLHTI